MASGPMRRRGGNFRDGLGADTSPRRELRRRPGGRCLAEVGSSVTATGPMRRRGGNFGDGLGPTAAPRKELWRRPRGQCGAEAGTSATAWDSPHRRSRNFADGLGPPPRRSRNSADGLGPTASPKREHPRPTRPHHRAEGGASATVRAPPRRRRGNFPDRLGPHHRRSRTIASRGALLLPHATGALLRRRTHLRGLPRPAPERRHVFRGACHGFRGVCHAPRGVARRRAPEARPKRWHAT